MKKIINLMLISVLTIMVLIPGVSAVTNNPDAPDGSITITGTSAGKTYNIYQILVLDSYADVDGNSTMNDQDGYIYKAPTSGPWKSFVESSTYLTIDAQGYVTWNTGDQVQFAKDALQYAKDNNIAPTATLTGNGGEITFSNLNYGYYLVDSSVGALCGLRTTSPNATVNEKNSDPTVEKLVKENNTFGSSNSAYIGETVYFQTTINVGKGAENYKLYDTMSNGLTFNQDSLTVKIDSTSLVEGTDYTVSFTETGYTFVVIFERQLADNEDVVVEYTAVVNENAVIGGEGNSNVTSLKYGDNHSVSSTTTTYTYSFDLVKTDGSNKLLLGAEFELYEKGTGNNPDKKIYLIDLGNGVYRVSYTGNDNNGAVIQAGKVTIKGLDSGDYYLVETKNPDGYTKLLDNVDFEIESSNLVAIMDGETWTEGGVHIVNTKGNLLPETGGMGTTLFIIIGSLMVTLFGVLLVTKFRMSKMDI